ncbi:MAG: hypothetical protein RI894_169 [Bacteroidota bacterium]
MMQKARGEAINSLPKFSEEFCGKTRREKRGVAELRYVLSNAVLLQNTSKMGRLLFALPLRLI